MQLTKQYLMSKYDYIPETESFLYKENPNKRVSWNERYAGKEVKPLKVGNVKYLYVGNATYPLNVLIRLIEKNETKGVNPVTIEELLIKDAKRKANISSMSIEELKNLQSNILRNQPYTLGKRKATVNRKQQSVEEVLKLNEPEPNNKQRHIYFDDLTSTYYVKIIFKNMKLTQFKIDSIEEALTVRNQFYNELKEYNERNK